jgi:hypothetical protein
MSVDANDDYPFRYGQCSVQAGWHDAAWVVDKAHMRVPGYEPLHDFQRTVSRTAVGHDNFKSVGGIVLRQYRAEATFNASGFVADRKDN